MKMKFLQICSVFIWSLVISGCEDVDMMVAVDAGLDAVKAVTLSVEDVKSISLQSSLYVDSKNKIAGPTSTYARRLEKIVSDGFHKDEIEFNVKAYIAGEVNAFAMGDGTIRVFSGLMDMMDDSELCFVIGHEMGHVFKQHVRKKMRLAYAGSAVRKGVASLKNEVGLLARSQIGGFVELLINAQFSQQEEREADDYGLNFLIGKGFDPNSAVTALEKLATLGSGHSFLSSHPAPEKRAERLRQKISEGLL